MRSPAEPEREALPNGAVTAPPRPRSSRSAVTWRLPSTLDHPEPCTMALAAPERRMRRCATPVASYRTRHPARAELFMAIAVCAQQSVPLESIHVKHLIQRLTDRLMVRMRVHQVGHVIPPLPHDRVVLQLIAAVVIR